MPEPRLLDVLQTADEVLACPPEELAWIVLEIAKARADAKGLILKSTWTQIATYKDYGHRDTEVAQTVIEGLGLIRSRGRLPSVECGRSV